MVGVAWNDARKQVSVPGWFLPSNGGNTVCDVRRLMVGAVPLTFSNHVGVSSFRCDACLTCDKALTYHTNVSDTNGAGVDIGA
jgi:hypothetical protein